jgi:hypothetical protein
MLGQIPRRLAVIATLIVGVGCSGPAGGPAPTVCPPSATAALSIPSVVPTAPTVYVFLVDRAFSSNGKASTSYPWPQLPATALQTISALMPKVDFKPGDLVLGAWISHNSNDPAEIFLPLSQIPADTPLDVPARPTPVPAPLNKLACNEYSLQIAAFNSAAKGWQEQVDTRESELVAARQASITAFVAAARSRMAQVVPQQDTVGTDVLGGLAVAAGVFKVNAGARKLVLFSDMADTVHGSVQPDMSGVDVVVALYHRDDVADQSLAQNTWRTTLQKLGAHSSTFIEWAATTPDKLVQLLGEGPR